MLLRRPSLPGKGGNQRAIDVDRKSHFTALVDSCRHSCVRVEEGVQAPASCLKCVACRLRRLTQDHSAADTLSLTKSSAKQPRRITHLRCRCVWRMFDRLHVCLISISAGCGDWTRKLTELEYVSRPTGMARAVFPNQVN